MGNVRSGAAWQRARQQVLREETHCHICKEWVDKDAPYRDRVTGRINGAYPTVHHLDPHPTKENVARRSRLRLAHWRCNTSYGDGTRLKSKTSRRW